jgi:hypothetical protein
MYRLATQTGDACVSKKRNASCLPLTAAALYHPRLAAAAAAAAAAAVVSAVHAGRINLTTSLPQERMHKTTSAYPHLAAAAAAVATMYLAGAHASERAAGG